MIKVSFKDENPCNSNPCSNNGICNVEKDTCSFKCQCLQEFTGPLCKNRIKPLNKKV